MMCFLAVCLFVFSIGSLQPLEVNADIPMEQKPLNDIERPTPPPLPSGTETLGKSPSPVITRENDVIPTPKPSLPYWKPLSTKSPSSQNPVPVPQGPEHLTPEPPGRKPTGPLPPPAPLPPQVPPLVPQTPKLPTPKPPGPTFPDRKPTGPLPPPPPPPPLLPPQDPPLVPQTPKLPTPKPPISTENEVTETHKPSSTFWKPWSSIFPTRKPKGPLPPTPKPPISTENEVTETHKPSSTFWKPWSAIFPTRKPKGPVIPPSKSEDLVFPTPKPSFPPKNPPVQKPKDAQSTDKKPSGVLGPGHTESNPTDSPNDISQKRDNGYGYESEERTTKKSYLKEVFPCCF